MKYQHLADPALPIRPMTHEEGSALFSIMMEPLFDQPFTQEDAEKIGLVGKVLFGWMQSSKVKLNLGAALLLSMMVKSPGEIVMWMNTIHHVGPRDRLMGAQDICTHFGDGFPSEEAYSMMWDAQKNERGNYLDQKEAWA